MPSEPPEDYATGIVTELRSFPSETEWVEFKVSQADPEEIGEYISALSNAAALAGKTKGYVIWGIHDETHDIVGTSFSFSSTKVGNEEIENWLLRLLSPKISFRFTELLFDQKFVVLLEIECAFRHPVSFKGQEFIRVGTYKKRLKDFPQKERELWRFFDRTPFESMVAAEQLDAGEVLQLLNYPSYFDLMKRPLPEGRKGILEALKQDDLIVQNVSGTWDITNLGGVLFASDLSEFGGLKRKAIRVVEYVGTSKVKTVREQSGVKGYAVGFQGLIEFINGRLPSNEFIGQALRKEVPIYPELAIRELVANALIHQDFFVTGAGPMVEIFEDRIEFTNPGKPLVSVRRFLDSPPKSRNEAIASLMRRVGICEERGSGIDKVVYETEYFQLPAPVFELAGENTRTILFSYRKLNDMDRDDRIRACYLHTCLKYVQRQFTTNSSVRERFGIPDHNSAIASRIIREAVDDGAVKAHDSEASRKYMKYVPFWAS